MGVEGKEAVSVCGYGPWAFAVRGFRAFTSAPRVAGQAAPAPSAPRCCSRPLPAGHTRLRYTPPRGLLSVRCTTARMSLKNLQASLVAPIRDPRVKRKHYRHPLLKRRGELKRKPWMALLRDSRGGYFLLQELYHKKDVQRKVHLCFQEEVSI